MGQSLRARRGMSGDFRTSMPGGANDAALPVNLGERTRYARGFEDPPAALFSAATEPRTAVIPVSASPSTAIGTRPVAPRYDRGENRSGTNMRRRTKPLKRKKQSKLRKVVLQARVEPGP